jgi:hypothetical protein
MLCGWRGLGERLDTICRRFNLQNYEILRFRSLFFLMPSTIFRIRIHSYFLCHQNYVPVDHRTVTCNARQKLSRVRERARPSDLAKISIFRWLHIVTMMLSRIRWNTLSVLDYRPTQLLMLSSAVPSQNKIEGNACHWSNDFVHSCLHQKWRPDMTTDRPTHALAVCTRHWKRCAARFRGKLTEIDFISNVRGFRPWHWCHGIL